MKIGVAGLWHLGNVYSLCLAEMGHEIVAYDANLTVIGDLRNQKLPVFEPGLDDLLEKANRKNNISYTNNPENLSNIDILFLTYDTPVDAEDIPDNDFVLEQFKTFANCISRETLIVITSQLPVGTCNVIREILNESNESDRVIVHPENLRLGKAIKTFFNADRIVFGTRSGNADETLNRIFEPLGVPIIWMHDKSAEMSKHALNAFLALSVTFMGEISEICEKTGADAHEVATSLKSDSRIGNRAYLSPGLGFAGGTLARDLSTLKHLQMQFRGDATVLNSIENSNKHNNQWIRRQINRINSGAHKKNICFWGISYTSNTSTLRRSAIYDEMLNLINQSYTVTFVEDVEIIDDIDSRIKEFYSIEESLSDIDILVISKQLDKIAENPNLSNENFPADLFVIDPFAFLAKKMPEMTRNEKYFYIGSPNK